MTTPAAVPAAADQGDRCVENDLGWALGIVFRRYTRASAAVLCDVPGGPRGYQVLTTIESGDPPRQLTLAQHLGLDRTVMTYLLDDLERAGLVERRPDPADRRARLVSLTDAGRSLLDRLEVALGETEAQLLGGLAEDERAVLRSLLQRVAMEAYAADPVRSACDVVEELGEDQRMATNPDS